MGHAGTLDPLSTGLLIVCVGKATKLADRSDVFSTRSYQELHIAFVGRQTSNMSLDNRLLSMFLSFSCAVCFVLFV